MSAPAADTICLHGTAISVAGQAVLLRGRSAAGKSDLALRTIALPPGPLVQHPPLLVADDRVQATATASGITLSCPTALRGLIEVRGVGIVRVFHIDTASLVLVADLVEPSQIERLPEPCEPAIVCGRRVARIELAPFEASAPLKLLLALAAVCAAAPA